MRESNVTNPERIDQEREGFSKKPTMDLLFVVAGALLASVSIELFLVPNQLVVSGMTGVSMMLAYGMEMRIGILLLLLNLPFLYFGARRLHKERLFIGFYGLLAFGIASMALHPVPGLTENLMPAAILGGAVLGIGIGLVIRCGGFLDAAERMGTAWMGRRYALLLSITANAGVLLAAWALFEYEQLLHSAVATAVVLLAANRFLYGSSALERMIRIESGRAEEVAAAIAAATGRIAVRLPSQPRREEGFTALHLEVSRLEEAAIREAALKADPDALINVRRGGHRSRY
ncbi:YitT family protein [Paenibacillus mendelii]|uniref:YitT family protein n=1 Tax=Paenibacillus mendelii TaxID=206163 RepID=A0ABV6JE49_9BACL|nr:YitT family protein [Paenibacillus mendelii]MCQ6562512.1 YitT family protein [Paenibacillus mendelii]